MNSHIRTARHEATGAASLLVLTSLLAGVFVAVLRSEWSPPANWPGVALGLAVQVAASLALLRLRRSPVAVAAVLTGTSIGLLLVQLAAPGFLMPRSATLDPYRSIDPWIPFATSAAATVLGLVADRRRAWYGWSLLGVLTVVATRPWQGSIGVAAGGVLISAVPALLGLYVAARRRLLTALTERAERAEREQELLAEQARADERARLAVEVHDLVTHRVSLMVLQASALRITGPDEPTRAAAEDLRAAGCQALAELRDLVGVLRAAPAAGPVGEPAGVAGPAGIELDLARLVAESQAVGVPVRLAESGDRSLASPVVARTAHRVVQEALTNARKHATGAPVRVEVRYAAGTVELTVENDAPPADADPGLAAVGSGTGLVGLRQRVELVRGTLSAGPVPGGGFRLDAVLPAYVPAEPALPAGRPA